MLGFQKYTTIEFGNGRIYKMGKLDTIYSEASIRFPRNK